MPRRKQNVQGATAPAPQEFNPDHAAVRLEVLRLANRHDLEPAQVIARAEALTAWVLGEKAG